MSGRALKKKKVKRWKPKDKDEGKVIMECPSCQDLVEWNFSSFLKEVQQLLRKKYSDKTLLVKYPCPKCGTYYEPQEHVGGYAYCICEKHGLFKTSIAVSLNFRKFCSKLGAAPNRNPGYYTSGEDKVRRYLIKVGEIEGLTFFHNARICVKVKNRKRYFWLDFMLPRFPLAVECNPAVWHRMWNRDKADERKKKYLNDLNVKLIELDDKEIAKIDLRKKVWCEKLDPIFRRI